MKCISKTPLWSQNCRQIFVVVLFAAENGLFFGFILFLTYEALLSWFHHSKLRTLMNAPSNIVFSFTFLNKKSSNWITKPLFISKAGIQMANKKSKQSDNISGTPLENTTWRVLKWLRDLEMFALFRRVQRFHLPGCPANTSQRYQNLNLLH